jgi:hypothetical protein
MFKRLKLSDITIACMAVQRTSALHKVLFVCYCKKSENNKCDHPRSTQYQQQCTLCTLQSVLVYSTVRCLYACELPVHLLCNQRQLFAASIQY